MAVEVHPGVQRESFGACVVRAMGLAASYGAALGAIETLKVLLTTSARSLGGSAALVAFGIGANALAGVLLAIPCALLAIAFCGRPQFRVARASSCAALGVSIALAAELLSSS